MSRIPVSKRLRFVVERIAFAGVAAVVPCLSRRGVRWLARALGTGFWRISARSRKIARANLALAFGETLTPAERNRIGRDSCRQFCATMLSLFWIPGRERQRLDELWEVDSVEWARLLELRAQGSGIIFVIPHLGDWEALGLLTSRAGLPTTIVMEMPANAAVGERIRQLRASTGNAVISQRGAAPKLLRALRRGEPIGLLIDLNADPRTGGVWVEFFGKPVYNNSAAAWLALRTGATLVLATGWPVGTTGKLRATFTPLPAFSRTGDDEADVQALSQLCLRRCEEVIREAPELWMWTYKRWKYHPPGNPAGYPFYTRPFAGAVAPPAAKAV